MKTLYINHDRGDVICTNHAGHYLQASLDAYPHLVVHETPLGRWVLATKQDADFFRIATDGVEFDCEICREQQGVA